MNVNDIVWGMIIDLGIVCGYSFWFTILVFIILNLVVRKDK